MTSKPLITDPAGGSDSPTSRALTIAYVIGLSLIAIFATVAWYATITMVSDQEQLAAEVNVAGRQRMLTQKIALLASRLEQSPHDARNALADEISACADLFERAHIIMLSRALADLQSTAAEGTDCRPGRIAPLPVGEMSGALEATYFYDPSPVDDLVRRYLALTRELLAVSAGPDSGADQIRGEIFALALGDLPLRLDEVAQILQHEGEAQVDQLVVAKTMAWVATLILLCLEVLFIFRPMVRRIDRAIRAIKTVSLTLAARSRSEQDLRHANDVKTRFLAQISHELRTPLNAIIGYSQMLAPSSQVPAIPPEKRDEYVGDIKNAGEHLLALVNDMLDLSLIETDTVTVNAGVVDIGHLIAGVAAMMKGQAARRAQRILVSHSEFPVSARVDERLLRQSLLNLVSNSLKYGRDEGHVRIDYFQPRQDHVEILIEDDGIGFDMERLPILLEPFERAETNPEIAPEGVGLGLPLANRLIEIQGGTLTLDSTPGVGTRAVVRVPSVERPSGDTNPVR